MRILILNGSIHGNKGNCGVIIQDLRRQRKDVQWDVVPLAKSKFNQALRKKIQNADAILFFTGTYWDSWGSPLQKFLEDATVLEGQEEVLGKPAGVCVLMHSVGGKSVLSRLQGVLSSMGCMIPPMSGMTYALSSKLASDSKSPQAEDFWCLEDLEVIIDNLILASTEQIAWKTWPVDRQNFRKVWT